MKRLYLSFLPAATLVFQVHAASPETSSDSLLQIKSLTFSCSFHPPQAASLERSDFYARYLNRQEPVAMQDFIQWVKAAYPEMTNLQCVPYKTVTTSQEAQNITVQQGEYSVEQSVIDYVFGEFPDGYTEDKENFKENAYGRQHLDNDGEILIVGFTGRHIAANAMSERRPIVWIVKLAKWGGNTFLWPCWECIKGFTPKITERIWGFWEVLKKGNDAFKKNS